MSRQTDQYLHDEGTLHLRQFHQQQGLMLRFRPGRRDRAQSDFNAHEGGPGSEAGRGSAAWKAAGQRREDAGDPGQLGPHRGHARLRHDRNEDLPQDRHLPQHVVQVPVADTGVDGGRSGLGGMAGLRWECRGSGGMAVVRLDDRGSAGRPLTGCPVKH